MIVNVMVLVRVQGTSKFAPTAIKKIDGIRSAAKAFEYIDFNSSEGFIAIPNRRYNAAEFLHMLHPVLNVGDVHRESETDAAKEGKLIAETTIKLCGIMRDRLELENKDLYFMWIAIKGSKEE